MKSIGIVGTRRRDTKADLEKTEVALLEHFEQGDRIVSGGCPKGGDRFAEVLARKYGATITIYHAAWGTYGRSAGFIRNSEIADNCDLLIAVVAENRKGGTEDTIQKARSQGKPVVLVD